MLAAMAVPPGSPDQPLEALRVGELTDPDVPTGWARVRMRAASLNFHDIFVLQGGYLADRKQPLVLGVDGAGIDEDGRDVIVHAVIGDPTSGGGDETLDPAAHVLSEHVDGTLAEYIVVPRRNLVPKPASLAWEDAACLPTAWLTAYRMLFGKAGLLPGQTVLVQGASGGLATAAIVLGRAAGLTVYCSSGSAWKRERALALGAEVAVATGDRLPRRVDAVIDPVGEATFPSSLRALRPGGTLVLCGGIGGTAPVAELGRIVLHQIKVVGSKMGTATDLVRLANLCASGSVSPVVDRVYPIENVAEALERMIKGEHFGKIVITIGDR